MKDSRLKCAAQFQINGDSDEEKASVGQSATENRRQVATADRQAESRREGRSEESGPALPEFGR